MLDNKHPFQIMLLGTGCPVVSPRRYGAGTLIRCGTHAILVDIGSGVTQRLVEAGSSGAEIDALLITHIHSDHLVDLYQFIISSWHQSRDRPQVIYGPPGIRKLVDDHMAAWREERDLRIAFEKRTSTAAFEIEIHEFEDDGVLFGFEGLSVTAVRVEHHPIPHAFGFVFEADGHKAVLSGDTKRCDALIAAAKGADVIVHEVFAHDAEDRPSGTRSAETMTQVANYHTLSTEVGEVAQKAGAGALVLTHIVPPSTDPARLIAEAREHFNGFIAVGEDLMAIDVINRRVDWRGMSAGF